MESPHLCLLYIATAEPDYPPIDTVVEEIVLLAYVVIDMRKNEVVGVQQYLVKPQVADRRINFLSKQLMEQSNLTQDLVKSGVPLGTAIQQFGRYVETTLNIDPSTRSLRFVTAGQSTLRHHLYPEASAKNIELPHYYASFHDLRKVFHEFYSTPTKPHSIKYILRYLRLAPSTDSDFYIKEIKDMIYITQRLLRAGCTFADPETINLQLEPRVYSRNDVLKNGCVVRIVGLPWDCLEQDIVKFFIGLNIAEGGIALCLSGKNRRNRTAFVRFVNWEHRNMALKRHKNYIGSRRIEVYRASREDFINVAGGSNIETNNFLSRAGKVIIQMIGLPLNCTAKQVLDFFKKGETCKVMDGEQGVFFPKNSNGKYMGCAFVRFAREDDAGKALSKQRESIGSQAIDLFRVTTAEVQQLVNYQIDPKTNEIPKHLPAQVLQVPLSFQCLNTSSNPKDCIRLHGLPLEAQINHIVDFLGDHSENIVCLGVNLVYDVNGQPTGEAFIQMNSEQNAFLSAQRQYRYMFVGGKAWYIELYQCFREEMNQIVIGEVPKESGSFESTAVGNVTPQDVGPGNVSSPRDVPGPVQQNPTAIPTMNYTFTGVHSPDTFTDLHPPNIFTNVHPPNSYSPYMFPPTYYNAAAALPSVHQFSPTTYQTVPYEYGAAASFDDSADVGLSGAQDTTQEQLDVPPG